MLLLLSPSFSDLILWQAFLAAMFVLSAVLLYLPMGLPVVDGLRTGRFAWVFLAGAAAGVILFLWHSAMIFPTALHFLHKTYGRFVFFCMMDFLALSAPFGLGIVSISLIVLLT